MVYGQCRGFRRPPELHQVQGRSVQPDLPDRHAGAQLCAAPPAFRQAAAKCACRGPGIHGDACPRAHRLPRAQDIRPVRRSRGYRFEVLRHGSRRRAQSLERLPAQQYAGRAKRNLQLDDRHFCRSPHQGSGCHRAWGFRQADRLLRTSDQPLVQAVQALRNRAHAPDGTAYRMAARDHPAAAREQRGPWRLPARQYDLPTRFQRSTRSARLGTVHPRRSDCGFQLSDAELA